MEFASLLLEWYSHSHRDLPWRRTRDPYAIWVSEIMLQQTRVAAVIPFYQRFLQRFPDVRSLAEAPEEELLAAWAGLGYYSRVRNMQKAARAMKGIFPETYAEIRSLPGIGDYTAAAIASIAFGLAHAAVDGNALRVLSRVTGDAGDIGTGPVKTRLTAVANRLLRCEEPGTYNQAVMELGATLCLPRSPQCLLCPVSPVCEAFRTGCQNQLPVKARKAPAIRKLCRVFVIEREQGLLLWRRQDPSEKLVGFWELPEAEQFDGPAPDGEILGTFRHAITNHQYTFEVRVIPKEIALPALRNRFEFAWIPDVKFQQIVLSTTTRKALSLRNVRAM
ncbi:MAG: A/G-specific adenine glycosylase [Bryobacteraceae bacterium]|nr:A/G-specific adenine glycosylase [Bryobacteraceae bacterium]